MLIDHSRRLLGGVLAAASLSTLAACGSQIAGAAQAPPGATAATQAATHRSAASHDGSTRATTRAAPTQAAPPTQVPSATRAPSAAQAPATTRAPAAIPTAATQRPAATSSPARTDDYAAARRIVAAHGFDPVGSAAGWYGAHELNAIVGVLHESADGKYQRVFFFVNGRYIGLDASQASGTVHVTNTGNDLVTASYGIFKPSDALCCPSSTQTVRFQWTGSRLVPLDPIPPNATGTTAGR